MTNAVLGGGITGLAAAYYLSNSGSKGLIKLFEASNRLGGWIKTTKTKSGTIFEKGPRTLRCSGAAAENTLQLVKELGLSASIQPVLNTNKAAKNRMICLNNQLIKLPNSWTALFKINPPFIKPLLYAIFNDLQTEKKNLADESIYDFVARRFGKEYSEILVSSVVCGIFAGDAKEISVKALMCDLFEKEQKYGNVFTGFIYTLKDGLIRNQNMSKLFMNNEFKGWSLWSLKNGMETLPTQLGNILKQKKNVKIYMESKCTNISFKNGEVVLTINGKTEIVKHLHSCLPSKDLAKILENDHSFLREELSMIPFVDVVTVNLEYDDDILGNEGFGFLVPPNQNLPVLGVIFDSCLFPQNGRTVLTVMMGGRWFEQYFGKDPQKEKLLEIALNHVKEILKINKSPTNSLVTILTKCIPQYIVGHSDRVKRIRSYVAEQKLPLTLMGNSFDGVGVNDAILSAMKNVQSAVDSLKE